LDADSNEVEEEVMRRLLLSLYLLLLGFDCFLFPWAADEGGLPKTIRFENVFPHVVFGQLGAIRYETELVFVNPDSRPALLELTFYNASGESAHELLQLQSTGLGEGSWSNSQGLCAGTVLDGDEHLYAELPAHSVKEFLLPGLKNYLVGKEFEGWVVARSNSPLTGYERIWMSDDRGFSSHVEVLGNSGGTHGEIDLIFGLSTFADTGVRTHQTGGIAFVNPGSQAAFLNLTLSRLVLDQPSSDVALKRTLQLPGHQKRAFLLDDLFTPSANASYRVTVDCENQVPLAILGIGFRSRTDPEGTPFPRADEPWLTISPPLRLKLPAGVPYSLPEEPISEAQLTDWALCLTRFGFVAARPGGRDVYPMNVGCGYHWSGITPDSATGLGVVYTTNDTGIFFGKSGKFLTLGYHMLGRTPVFRPLADPNLVEIEMGSGCQHSILTIDVSREEVVSKKRGTDYCWF